MIEGNKEYGGIGDNGGYDLDGKDYFIWDGYWVGEEGGGKLIIGEMSWRGDGWGIVKL